MKRKMLSILLTAGLTAGMLTGCGSSATVKEEPAQTSKSSEKSTAQMTTSSTQTADSKAPTLTVWAWDASFNGVAMHEADQLYKGATVNFVEMSKADCLEKINTVLASGVKDNLPDIVLIGDASAQGYLMSYPDAFVPMDEYIKYSDFASYKKAQVSYSGKSYGVPFDTGVTGLFYRTDYISQAGYTDEDMQNLTWDSYMKLGEKLKEKGHDLQTFNPNDISDFQIYLQGAGKWFTDADGKADFVKNDALKKCYDNFKALKKSSYVKEVSDWNGFQGAINGGDVACVIRGSWITSTIKAAADQSGKWKVAPIPTLDGVQGSTNKSNQGGSSWYVLKNSANSKLAVDFLAKTFAGNKDLYNTLLKKANIMGTYLPASGVSAYDEEDAFFSNQKVNSILAGWIPDIPVVNTGAYTSEAQAALLAVTPDILAGKDQTVCLQNAEKQFDQTIHQ